MGAGRFCRMLCLGYREEVPMNKLSRNPLCAVLAVSLLGAGACTNTRPIEPTEEETYSYNLEPGDKIRLMFLDESVHEITVTEFSEDGVTGKRDNGSILEAQWADVYSVEQVTFAPMKTAGATLGVIVAIPIVAAGALLYGFGCGSSGGC